MVPKTLTANCVSTILTIDKFLSKILTKSINIIGNIIAAKIYYKLLNATVSIIGFIVTQRLIKKILTASITTLNKITKKINKLLLSVVDAIPVLIAVPEIRFVNSGHVSIKPEMMIKKSGNGTLTITNLNSGDVFEMTDLSDQEELYINCDKEIIVSDLSDTRARNLTNYQFLELSKGVNVLKIEGASSVKFRYRLKYYR